MKRSATLAVVACLWAAALVWTWSPAQAQAPDALAAPQFNAAGQLVRPLDYRDWVFLTSGLGMTYGPAAPATGRPPMFDNVFVTRAAYREFLRSGTWPDKTMFVLEIRRSEENASINNGGRTQGGIAAMEAAVKDVTRFPDGGWGYFSFDGPNGTRVDSAAPLPATASCYSCHRNNTAVENTFVQFYPELMDVARRMGTVKPTYDPSRKAN
jgi:hypothetical protein